MPPFFRLALVLAVPLGVAACFVDSSDHGHSMGGSGTGPATSVSGNGSGNGPGGDGSPSQYPITAKIDSDQTMQVNAGQGVGVFTEYVSGGHWHVWWTCDSSINPQGAPCAFGVKISAGTNSIRNVTTQQFATTDSISSSPAEIDATTTTSTAFDGLLFDTAPGDTITISATVGGLYDGRFLFFVEDGKIDDGSQIPVTDPINLVPSAP
jgi:hypothetical protein